MVPALVFDWLGTDSGFTHAWHVSCNAPRQDVDQAARRFLDLVQELRVWRSGPGFKLCTQTNQATKQARFDSRFCQAEGFGNFKDRHLVEVTQFEHFPIMGLER